MVTQLAKHALFDESGAFLGYEVSRDDTAGDVSYHTNPDEIASSDGPVIFSSVRETFEHVNVLASQLGGQVDTFGALFDGSKSVKVGKLQAPIGIVLGGGLLAVFAYKFLKDGEL